ncbi:hypothetical protein [Nocardioides sp. CFH 31398]|uniref:hypothetical protein n=1 Tax=Nocardioides sp. CFH 31398 TaxID=2919579 RepID=UPI001F065D39|nr:hypothetical protein [Nocardioides sp. CFH 31398]MCH1865605.1 hypothetical protein [Nocardioides sp. CFH 31398]
MSAKVLLHVGTPKTGTSHLQDVLFRNRERLAGHGIHYPADRFDGQFLAALDLMRMPWGGLETQAVGAWDDLAARVRAAEGTSIVSHEILAAASASEVARALESLGHGDGAEVHLVLSVRDLARQVPAEWQENVKHRATLSYAKFLRKIRDPHRNGRIPSWFWAVQEVPDILDRWGSALPPERVHVVTVPQPDAPRSLLWERFSSVMGLDGLELDLDSERANPSLGVPETALVRRLNRKVNRVIEPAAYRELVRELIVHRTLSQRTRTARLTLPPEVHPWAVELSEAWTAEIRDRGYDVVGDLDDLRCGPPATSYVDPDSPREKQVTSAATVALRALLEEHVRLMSERDRLVVERDEARWEAQAALSARLRRRLETNLAGRVALKAYRVGRGRSSLSA